MANYFSHDSNARSRTEIIRLRMKYGWEGYGLYFAIIEKMAESKDYKLSTDYELLAYDLMSDVQKISSIVNDFGLFKKTEDGKYFYPDCLLHRIKRKRMYNTNVQEWMRIRREVFERDHYICQYCGKIGGTLEVDHIIPFSKGGSDNIENLITSCRKCNRQKKDKSVEEFIMWRKEHGTE